MAVYWVVPVRLDVGVNVAGLPLVLTAPVTAAPPALGCRVKVAVLSVELVIAPENVADTEVFSATPVAPLAGYVEDTVGSGVLVKATAVSPGCSPPQPNRLRVANRAVANAAAETLDLIFWFSMWEALK